MWIARWMLSTAPHCIKLLMPVKCVAVDASHASATCVDAARVTRRRWLHTSPARAPMCMSRTPTAGRHCIYPTCATPAYLREFLRGTFSAFDLPRHLAAAHSLPMHRAVMARLLTAGADPNVASHQGRCARLPMSKRTLHCLSLRYALT